MFIGKLCGTSQALSRANLFFVVDLTPYPDHRIPMTQITHQLGTPLLQCSPFAQILLYDRKNDYCDYCFQEIDQMYSCPNGCNYAYYCSQGCCKNDLSWHRNECMVRLVDKIKANFSEKKIEQCSAPGFQQVANCFSYSRIIDYTMLFFRMLQQLKNGEEKKAFDAMENQARRTNHQTRFGPFHASVGNLERRISWKDISIPFAVNRKPMESSSSDYLTCEQDFDAISYEETIKIDERLGFDMPNDEYFENILRENEVKYILSNIMDSLDSKMEANKEVDSNEAELGSGLNTPVDFEEENLHDLFMKDLEKRKINLSQLPYDQAMSQYALQFEWFKKSRQEARKKRCQQNSQENFDQDLNNEFESISFEMLTPQSSRMRSYVSPYLTYNIHLISDNEQETLNTLKMEYRLGHLAGVSKKSSADDSELDYYFGVWICAIQNILAQSDVATIYGISTEIYKIFYVTIRNSITIIRDEFGLLPVARAIYLPLVQFEHCCFANTSLVFERNYLKVFYNPPDKLGPSDSKQVTLGLKNIKVNFLNDITMEHDSITNYLFNRIRMLACKCDRCKQSKKMVEIDPEYQLFPVEDSDFRGEHEDLFSSDIFSEYVDLPSQILPDQSCGREYDFELFRLNRANKLQGNRNDLEYSLLFHKMLVDVLESYREIFGYYHTHCTAVLLLINYCNLTIIKSKENRVEMFYYFKYSHRYLVQLIDSVANTHGSQHWWLSKLDKMHQVCHNTMQLIFSEHKSDIVHLDKENQTKKFCSESTSPTCTTLTDSLLLFEHCSQLLRLPDNEQQIIDELGQDNSPSKSSCQEYYYNPFDMFESESNLELMQMGETCDPIDTQIELIFDYLNPITEHFYFRFL